MVGRGLAYSTVRACQNGVAQVAHARYHPAVVNVQQTYRRLEPAHAVLALTWGLGMLIPVLNQMLEGAGIVAASLLALDAAGLVCEHWGVADMLSLMQQLGVVPAGAPT